MFDKRLLSLVPGIMPLIVGSVAAKWIALLCNIAIIATIGNVFAALLAGMPASGIGSGAAAAGAAAFGARAAMTLAMLIIVRAISIYVAQRAGDKAAFAAKRQVRQLVYDKLVQMGPAYTEQVSTAEAVQTGVEGAQQLEVYFGGYLPQLFYAVLAPVTLFVALVGQAGLPATVLLVIAPLIPISIMMVMRNAKKVAAEYWGSYVDLGGSFLEAVQGLTTLKIYQADGRWHKRMNDESEGFRRATMKMLRVQLNSINVMDLVAFGGAAAGIVVAVLQLASGAIGFSGAFLVVFLSQEFFLPMRRLGSLFHTAMNGMSAAKTMFRILDAPVPPRGERELDGRGDIVCRGVGYSYGEGGARGEHVVLDQVNCSMRRGSLVAIVGESGSGKSTLAGILSGRKASYLGKIEVGGVDVRDATLDSLMRAVTLVPTAGHLFAGSLRSNLLLARPDATDRDLMDVLERCRIAGFVRANGGLDMELAEGGANLSGGQRQRVCVARALLHDSPIYIFDEATSNVDVESERAIGRVIDGLAGDHTVIVIAHRLASVAHADQTLVFSCGHLVEQGTHAQLLAAGGIYASMWSSQHELSAYALDEENERASMPAGVVVGAAALESGPAPVQASHAAAGAPSSCGPRRSAFSIMARMIGLVRPLAAHLALAVALGTAGSLAATFVAAFGGYGIMAATGQGTGLAVASACVLAVACGVLRGPLHYGEQLANHYIAFRLLALIRDHVFDALRRLAPAKLEGRDRGDLVSLVTADIELLEVFYAHTISPIAIAIASSAIMLAFIGAHSLPLAAIALAGYLVLGAIMPIASSKLCGNAGRASRDAAGSISAYVLDGLRGLAETVQFAGVSKRSAGLAAQTDAMGSTDRSLHVRSAAVEGLADAMVLLTSLAMIATSLGLYAAGDLSFSSTFICSFAYLSSFGPVLAVCRLGTSLQATLASGARVLDLLDEEPQTVDVLDGADVTFDGAACEHVTFSYGCVAADTSARTLRGVRAASNGAPACMPSSKDDCILDDISISFEPGEMVCVTGRSGSGKSTLLKLLMRFWDPTSGAVTMSGRDLRGVNTASLRNAIGYMTQDTHLFVGTIGDNLRIAREDATDSELDSACEAAALTSLIARLPQGYDTPVAELGDSLSGGERQRIGLARIFLHDAPFVLLDEPTSNLDALNEAAVMRAIDRRRAGKTVVLVSHRASTCAFADRFYSVEHGRIS